MNWRDYLVMADVAWAFLKSPFASTPDPKDEVPRAKKLARIWHFQLEPSDKAIRGIASQAYGT